MTSELLHRIVGLLPVLALIVALVYAAGRLRQIIDDDSYPEEGEL